MRSACARIGLNVRVSVCMCAYCFACGRIGLYVRVSVCMCAYRFVCARISFHDFPTQSRFRFIPALTVPPITFRHSLRGFSLIIMAVAMFHSMKNFTKSRKNA